MLIMDYITEQNEIRPESQDLSLQQPQQQPGSSNTIDTEVEPIKKLTITNLFYKLFISLNTSFDPEYNKIAMLIENILKFSDILSYETLVELLDRVVAYLTQAKQRNSEH